MMLCNFLFTVLLLVASASAQLNIDRIHLVDYFPKSNAFFFRGNAPLINNENSKWSLNYTYQYPLLMQYLAQRANEANISFPPPEKVYLVDLALDNPVDGGYETEVAWWKLPENQNKGELLQWILIGNILYPDMFSTATQQSLIENGTIWVIDKIPERMLKLRQMLEAGPPPGFDAYVVYSHCSAGCDRTGEFVASYRMAYHHQPTLEAIYLMNIPECGREPNFYLTAGIAWYCTTWNLLNSSASQPPMPDCNTAYSCKAFGPCVPSNTSVRLS